MTRVSMSELSQDIQEAIMDSELTYGEIAEKFNVPVDLVYEIESMMLQDELYNDSLDGDFDTAMASAGFGTDEDYGYYGDEQ